MSQHTIESSGSFGSKAVIDTDGGRLASLQINGLEVLITEGAKPTRWGSFPMVPWCGRLADGRLRWNGAEFQFPLSSPPHANHGFAHTQRWELVEHGESTIEIVTSLVEPWPFGGVVRQRFEMTPEALRIEIQVESADRPMPAMAGWHPWFRRELTVGGPVELAISPGSQYETDEALIPTGRLIEVSPEPWNVCFVGLDQAPVLSWPGALNLAIESDFDHWVVFTEPEHAVCVEPQSGPPNQPNDQARVLEPGEQLIGNMMLRWSLHNN